MLFKFDFFGSLGFHGFLDYFSFLDLWISGLFLIFGFNGFLFNLGFFNIFEFHGFLFNF